jgi:Transglutaminase-like superfamily
MTFRQASGFVSVGGLLALGAWREKSIAVAVRWRNALLLQPARAGDFAWIPPHFPADFKVERRSPPPELQKIVAALPLGRDDADWINALKLAAHLTEHVEDKGPIQADLITTYHAIRNGQGYCADFVRVFVALAHTCGLTARQWAFSFDGFGGHGHTVVEVFDRQRKKWLLIDVLNNFHVVDASSGEPMGALEYRDSLRGRRQTAMMRPNGPGRPGFVHEHKAIEYYAKGMTQWYLWWGNAVFSYDAHPLVRACGALSRPLAHLAGILAGVQPRIRLYETVENAGEVRRIFALRRILIAAATIALTLAAALIALALATAATR